MKKIIKELYPYVIIVVVVVLFRTFIATPVRVDGDSMKDTLHNNDILILNKMDKSYERFDIVVVDVNGAKLVKRIIGLPGENISYKDNELYINGEIDESMKKDFYYVGNKYFVPLKYPDNEDFPVVVNLSPISFVKNIDWNIFGGCQVNVTNKLFGPPGDPGEPRLKVIYRPIDLQEPFPKGKDAQWSRWYKGSNKNRIKNTMKRSPIYAISLTEGSSKSGKLGTDAINRITVNYNHWTGSRTGIDADGVSTFINSSFSTYFTRKASNSSYCKIGYFKSSCDELR